MCRADSSEPTPPPVASPQYGNSRSPSPTPKPIKPFRDEPSDDEGEPEQSHHEILQQQQDMMDGECLTQGCNIGVRRAMKGALGHERP